ncbi:NRDE family protein [Moheibacter stercoris]|uniref:Uncharacterized protein with NRDE domain n=1 Tax=Moheibacter stercoris TaxID=1628251 RepID=A0ABV2LTA2_9FLAO
MCILSIFSKQNGDFILTQNRDESHLRPTSDKIENRKFGTKEFTGPIDLVSNGTWMYYAKDYVVCILNGEYEKHQHRPPYARSRGLIALDFLNYSTDNEFVEQINLENVEPFTMVMLDRHSSSKNILVWDGQNKYLEDHSDEQLIVRSSSTLYDAEEKLIHLTEFQNMTNPTKEIILEKHDDLKMHPNDRFPTVQTTSITQIIQMDNQIELKFCPISF